MMNMHMKHFLNYYLGRFLLYKLIKIESLHQIA